MTSARLKKYCFSGERRARCKIEVKKEKNYLSAR